MYATVPVIQRIKQKSLDVLDLADALSDELALDRDRLADESVAAAQRILGCLALLEEKPCALWALEELSGKAARLGAVFSIARWRGFIDDEREQEAVALCMDLAELARAYVRDCRDGGAYPPN